MSVQMENKASAADHLLTSIPAPFSLEAEAALDWRDPLVAARGREAAALKYGRCLIDALAPDMQWDRMHIVGAHTFVAPGGLVYFVGGDRGLVKIGHTTMPVCRIAAMQACSPVTLRFLAVTPGGAVLEQQYHRRFAAHRLHGEWFERAPKIEAEIAALNGGMAA